MNRFISQKFRFYSFVCIALLLFVHGYNLKEGYLIPASLVSEPLTFTSFFEYFISNGLLRFRIPMLFMISGYIFSFQDTKPYLERVKRRFGTLMIPFFVWSAVGIGITFLLQQFPITALAVKNATIDQLGNNKPYAELGWWEVVKRWLLAPVSYQLWFIRNLFIYNLMYPFFRWIVTRYPIPWFGLMLILMIKLFSFFVIDAQGMFFFTLGIWLNKSNFPIDRKPVWFSAYLYWLIFIGLLFIKTFMAFEFDIHNAISFWGMMILHFASVIAGLIAIWFSADRVVSYFMNKKSFVTISRYSFIIFGLHVPLLPYLMQIAYLYGHNIPCYRLIFYFLVPAVVFCFCIAVGAVLRKAVPAAYRIATGGRGL